MFITIQVSNSYFPNYLIIKKKCFWSLIIKLQNIYIYILTFLWTKKHIKLQKLKQFHWVLLFLSLDKFFQLITLLLRILYTMYYPFLLVTFFFLNYIFFRLLLHNTKWSKHWFDCVKKSDGKDVVVSQITHQ